MIELGGLIVLSRTEPPTFGEVRLGSFDAPLKIMHANPLRRKVQWARSCVARITTPMDQKPKRRLSFRQCDLERAIRAAKAAGAGRVTVLVDGSISIEVNPEAPSKAQRDRDRIIVL